MLKNLKIRTILSINLLLTVSLVVVFSWFVLFSVSDVLKKSLIERGQTEVAALINVQARNHLPDDLFSDPDLTKTQNTFTSFFKEVKTNDILRIKAWDRNARVIAANDTSLIGKSFPENEEFQEAIKGEVVSEIKEHLGAENIKEQGYEQLMEVYVPIFSSDGGAEVIGVIETYTILDSLNRQTADAQKNLMVKIVVVSIPLILLLGGLFFKLYRKVHNGITTLSGFAKVLGSGQLAEKLDMESQDELSEVAHAMNKMADELNKSLTTKNELEEQLKKRITEVQSKVDEVERMNKLMVNRELKMVELKKELATMKGLPTDNITAD